MAESKRLLFWTLSPSLKTIRQIQFLPFVR